MKYIVFSLPEEIINPEYAGCASVPNLNTEEEAIKEATRVSRRNHSTTPVGIFKLVKTVEPPSVIVKDITE